jgi:hypothetical protein
MRTTDVKVGDTVLWHWKRRDQWVEECDWATVLKVGVPHTYWVKTGGWNGSLHKRTTDKGIRIRAIDLDGIAEERVTIAAHLLPGTEENQTIWNEAAARNQREQVEQVARDAQHERIIERLAALNIEPVHADHSDDHLSLSLDDIERLLPLF